MSETKAVCAIPKMAYRIERDGEVLAMALAMADGSWGLFSADESKRLSRVSFQSVFQALQAYRRRAREQSANLSQKPSHAESDPANPRVRGR